MPGTTYWAYGYWGTAYWGKSYWGLFGAPGSLPAGNDPYYFAKTYFGQHYFDPNYWGSVSTVIPPTPPSTGNAWIRKMPLSKEALELLRDYLRCKLNE